MSNVSIPDLVAATLESRTGELADNISNFTPLLKRLNTRENIVPLGGGGHSILEELEYAFNSTVGWYSGGETLSTEQQQFMTAAQYDIRQLAGTITMTGREELINYGREQKIAIVDAKLKNLKTSLMNALAIGLHADGTGAGGRQIQGLQAFISTNPTSGTVGGINRATWAYWRNQTFAAVADGGAATSTANIQDYLMRTLLRGNLVRDGAGEYPDIMVMDSAHYRTYYNSLLPYQRVEAKDSYGSGFKALKFFGLGGEIDVLFAGNNVGMPANTTYFLNTKYIRLRPHSGRNMTRIGQTRRPINQDASVEIIGWAGNMTMSNAAAQAVLSG